MVAAGEGTPKGIPQKSGLRGRKSHKTDPKKHYGSFQSLGFPDENPGDERSVKEKLLQVLLKGPFWTFQRPLRIPSGGSPSGCLFTRPLKHPIRSQQVIRYDLDRQKYEDGKDGGADELHAVFQHEACADIVADHVADSAGNAEQEETLAI